MNIFLRPKAFDTACVIEIENTGANLAAHVTLADQRPLMPGDRVTIHDAPRYAAFGQSLRLERTATVQPASAIERVWTKLCAGFALTELYEVSFTPGRLA
jgi:hypothetical protein